MRNDTIAPVPHSWHVDLANGTYRTHKAHDCNVQYGSLTFWNLDPEDDEHLLLVKAYAPPLWRGCVLIDTPYSPDVQFTSDTVEPDELVESRH